MRSLVFAFMIALTTSLTAAAQEKAIFQLTGNGARNTQPFTVDDRWEVRWDARTEQFTIHLFNVKGKPIGMLPIASQEGPGQGATFRPDGGSYYLKIIATGDWAITVVQLP